MGKTQPQLWTLHIRAWWMQSKTTFAHNNQKPTRLFCCFIWGSHLAVCPWNECNTPRDGGQVTELVWSQWDCCLRPGEGDEMFSGCSRGTPAGKKQATSFSLPSLTTLNFSNLSHRIGFFPPATNRPTLYFHHLTHIQNCFLVGAAPETRSKPLIQLQNADWKAVTSALEPLSVPRQPSISKAGWHASSSFIFI